MGFQKNYAASLCWKCANAVPYKKTGCSWSRDLIPVEGWTAIQSGRVYDYHDDKRENPTYCVVECPEFSTKKCDFEIESDIAYKNLMNSVVLRAVVDYKTVMKKFYTAGEDVLIRDAKQLISMNEMLDYANRISARFRGRKTKEGYEMWHYISDFTNVYRKKNKELFNRLTHSSDILSNKFEIESFFKSERFIIFSDLDPDVVINTLKKSVLDEIREEGEECTSS